MKQEIRMQSNEGFFFAVYVVFRISQKKKDG